MTFVEEEDQRRIAAMTPAEKLARMHALLHWARTLYARQARERLKEASEERLKWEVALRQYGSDPIARTLIERKIRDVEP